MSNYDTQDGHATHVAPPQYQGAQQPQHGGMPGPGMPMQQPYGYGMGPWAMRPRRMYPIETKPFFLTSEFAVSLVAAIGIAITAATSDAFGSWRAWILIAAIVASYNLARGIAKSGTRSHSSDPRENLDLNWFGGNDAGDNR